MAERAGSRRRTSARTRLPSLKAELNNSCEAKHAETRLSAKTKRPQERKNMTSDEMEGDCLEEMVKGRKRQRGSKSSSTSPCSPEVKVRKLEEDEKSTDDKLESTGDLMEAETGCGLPTEGYWSHYQSLCHALPGREGQIEQLLTLFGEESSYVPPSVYIYGNSGTGKTHTLQTIVNTLKLPCAFVNCQECYCSRLLYETILNRLKGWCLCGSLSFSSYVRCDNMATFLQHLKELFDTDFSSSAHKTLYIMLDHAERLRDMEPNLLPALLRLPQLCGKSVCVVMLTEMVYERLSMVAMATTTPLPIHFPNYTKAETLAIMEMDLKSFGERPRPFCQTYTNHIWNVFQNVCRDLSELRHLCTLLFPKYCEPVDSGDIGEFEVRKLWHHIQPYFHSLMSRVFLRELSSTQFETASSSQSAASSSSKSIAGGVVSSLELPLYSKYLLLASYIASYNPASTDKRLFSKQKQSKVRKSRTLVRQKEKPNYHKLGPKPFPLDRLMAIFYSILEEPVSPSIHIYSQVSMLVTLQLLSQQNSRDSLDSAKYKCLVTFDFIQQVARSIGFDIIQYLQDFN